MRKKNLFIFNRLRWRRLDSLAFQSMSLTVPPLLSSHPEPREIEILCRLLNTVGKGLDDGKARIRMKAVYNALNWIRLFGDLESQIKFKILVCVISI